MSRMLYSYNFNLVSLLRIYDIISNDKVYNSKSVCYAKQMSETLSVTLRTIE